VRRLITANSAGADALTTMIAATEYTGRVLSMCCRCTGVSSAKNLHDVAKIG
jgi:hypothetical protein